MIVVFDIDGTLANCEHRLHHIKTKPKNWKAFFDEMHLDTPIEPICELLENHHWIGDVIIFCTGRPETHRKVTEDWLRKHVLEWDIDEDFTIYLYMRHQKDNRPDYETKVELMKQITEEHSKPDIWYDDRRGVVKALRENGIRVLQVADSE